MLTSPAINEIAAALCKFQSQVPTIPKTQENPYYKSMYAGLSDIQEAIKPHLFANGLSYVQFPKGTNELTTRLMHNSGEWLEETYSMTPVKNDPQGLGSCITYMKRYALSAILGLNTDIDDDGNLASQAKKPVEKKSEKKPVGIKSIDGRWLNTGKRTDGSSWYAVTEPDGKRTYVKEDEYFNLIPKPNINKPNF